LDADGSYLGLPTGLLRVGAFLRSRDPEDGVRERGL